MKLQKPNQKVSAKDLAKKLEVTVEPAVAPEKKRVGSPPKVQAPVAPPAPVVAPAKAQKVTSIADKKAAKATAPVAPPAPAVKPPKASKVAPPPVVEAEDEQSWDEIFESVIKGKNFNYIRQDNMTLAEIQANLPKANVHMLMAEEREDGKFTNMVLCFVSKEKFTFIDQTGDEDMDSLIQVSHDEIIGKRELKTEKHTFPFALYLKEPKVKGK